MSRKKQKQLYDFGWLRRTYEDEGRTLAEMGEIIGCSASGVLMALRRAGIRTRNRGNVAKTEERVCSFCDKKFIVASYTPNRRCCSKSCARSMKYKNTLHNREWLIDKYVTQKMSTREIGALIGSSDFPVSMALFRLGIPRRGNKEAKKLAFDRRGRKQVGRQEVINAYGGKCACCGETTPEFLTLDHIGGGGNAHRESFRKLGQNHIQMIRRQLKSEGWPKDKYRLLCMNCQFGYMHGRTCPHQLKREMGCGKPETK